VKNEFIAFERDKGVVAALIRFFIRYDSNHLVIQYDSDDWAATWTLEATTTRGAHTKPMRKRKWTHVYRVNDDALTTEIQASSNLVGEGYDFAAILLFGWIFILWDYLKLKIFRPHWSFKGQMCSELVANILNKKFEKAFEEPQWTSPAAIAKFLDDHPDTFTKIC
jgi:hypothetical protein